MSRTVLRVILAGALLLPTPALADWISFGESTSGAIWQVDPARMSTEGGRKRIWIKIDYSRDPTVKYRSEMRLYSVICSSRKYRILSYVEYDSYGKAVGSNQVSDALSDYSYSYPTPETMAESIVQIACDLAE